MKKNIQVLFEEYIYECEFVQLLKPKTIQDSRQVYSLLIRLQPSVSIETLSIATMTAFFKQLQERKRKVGKTSIITGVSKSTVVTYWSKLSRFFSWLVARGYLECNPLSMLKRPNVVYDAKQFLEKRDIEKIMTAILTTAHSPFLLKRNLVIFYLLLYCGLRREEMLLLQVRDIDLDKRIITVRAATSKVERSRQIPINAQVVLHLKEYLRERKHYRSQYLVTASNRDSGLTRDGLKHLVGALREASGISFHVHQFRHTFAVNFLNFTNNLPKLQQLLGHSNPAMTLQYTRCLPPGTMRSDIESMQIDNFI